jgi:hypothetical protein
LWFWTIGLIEIVIVGRRCAVGTADAAGGIDQSAFDRRRAISDQAARLRCFHSGTSVTRTPPFQAATDRRC